MPSARARGFQSVALALGFVRRRQTGSHEDAQRWTVRHYPTTWWTRNRPAAVFQDSSTTSSVARGIRSAALTTQTRSPKFSDTFMKRLCQVTQLVEAARIFADRPPVSAHSPLTQLRGMGARTGHTSSASSSSIVPHPAVARWLTLLCALWTAPYGPGAR